MKKIITVILLLTTISVSAQEKEPHSIINVDWLKKLKTTQMIFDGGYTEGKIMNETFHGGTMSFGVVINDFWYTVLSFDFMYSRDVMLDSTIPVVNPRYAYSGYFLNNEFIIGSKSAITLTLPVRVGVGYANYYDKYSDSNTNQRKSIADDVFFDAEAGCSVYINFLKNVSLGGTAKYRYTYDAERIGTDADFTQFAYDVKLRFRFFTPESQTEQKKNDAGKL